MRRVHVASGWPPEWGVVQTREVENLVVHGVETFIIHEVGSTIIHHSSRKGRACVGLPGQIPLCIDDPIIAFAMQSQGWNTKMG